MISPIEEPSIGRPSKYGSEAERAAAKREQNRLSQRRVRKKSLYQWDSSDTGQTPDQAKQSLVHVLNEWAEIAPDVIGTGGFCRSNWVSKSDSAGQGYRMFAPTTDLFAEMRGRQDVLRTSKEANALICPTIFGQPPQLPDHLTAMGITTRSSVRMKGNAVGCRGLLFDIENGSMRPEDFGEVFPDLEFLACSSWSHTLDTPRYRILIPSAQFIAPGIHTLILHTIVAQLEAAGWGDAMADGRKHGVDIGKLHEAAMFYLPSSRPNCFLVHFCEGRKPLDPREWIKWVPDDLLASPPPPVPPEIHHQGDKPVHKDKQVQWAIEYWSRRGCVKGNGRTQLWLLAKRLAEAGCDDVAMRDILDQQAGYSTNPDERRGEIDGLLTDPQVVAAMWSMAA